MAWWMWLVLGLLLLVCELLTPGGLYLFFLGLSALGVGALVGLIESIPLWSQWLLFSVLSLVAALFFRRPLLDRIRRLSRSKAVDSLVGEIATALEDIPVDAIGKAELRGTAWNALNIGDSPLVRAQRCRVERLEGLTLHVRKESK
jgi:membrane protein implicated in regulation of membrane protease activity